MVITEKFESYFKTAVEQVSTAYVDARVMIIEMGPEALPLLQSKAQTKADWKTSMIGEILSGWIINKELFEECTILVKGIWPYPGPKPVTGSLTPDRRASALAERGEAVVPRLLEMLIKTKEYKNQDERDAIFLALGYLRDKRAVMPLLVLLENENDEYTRVRAMGALGIIRDPLSFDPILKILQREELGDVLRGTSAVILGSFRDNRAFEPLVAILLNNKNSLNLRLDAIYGLDNLGNEQATGPLMKTLSAERDIDLLQAVIVTLGKIGDASSLEPLNEIAQSHTDEDIRGSAQEAMAKIKSRLGQR